MCTEKETSSRESREGLVGSEQQDDTPASLPYTASHSNKQHGARYNQQQQQPMPAVSSSQRLKNPATCRVLMIDGIEYELAVEVLCKMFVIWAYLVFFGCQSYHHLYGFSTIKAALKMQDWNMRENAQKMRGPNIRNGKCRTECGTRVCIGPKNSGLKYAAPMSLPETAARKMKDHVQRRRQVQQSGVDDTGWMWEGCPSAVVGGVWPSQKKCNISF